MKFDDWFKKWMQEHPLRVPSENNSRRFTQDVMRQIRADISPAHKTYPVPQTWTGWRLAIALPSVAVLAALLAVAILHFTREQGPGIAHTTPPPPQQQDVAAIEPLVVADQQSEPDVEVIVAILTALDEDLVSGSDLPPEALAEALRWLDEADLSS